MIDKCIPSQAYKYLVKETDGPISRYINRRISSYITCFLINHKIFVSPNKITLFVFALGIFTALIIPYNPLIGGILVQIVSIIDGVDGEIARLTHRTSRFGAFLDSVLDRCVDAAIIASASIYLLNFMNPIQAIIISGTIISSSLIISYIHTRGESIFGAPIQLVGRKIYAGRDIRLFVIAISLIFLPVNTLLFLTLLVFLTAYMIIYIFYKIACIYKLENHNR